MIKDNIFDFYFPYRKIVSFFNISIYNYNTLKLQIMIFFICLQLLLLYNNMAHMKNIAALMAFVTQSVKA